MKQLFALAAEANSTIRHLTRALRDTNLLAQIGLRRGTEFALAALWHVAHDDAVARRHRRYAFSDRLHNAAALMPKNSWEQALRIVPAQGIRVSVTNASRAYLDAHFAGLGRSDRDLLDRQRLLRAPCHRRFASDGSHISGDVAMPANTKLCYRIASVSQINFREWKFIGRHSLVQAPRIEKKTR